MVDPEPDPRFKKNDNHNPRYGEIIDVDIANELTQTVPSHLLEPNWLEFEYRTALEIVESAESYVEHVKHRARVKDIHQIRVILRRWFSVFEVLKEDGWETRDYDKKIGKKLKRFYKSLGGIRDWDVNCKMAKELKFPRSILNSWKKKRIKQRKKYLKRINEIDLQKLLKGLKKHLNSRYRKLKVDYIRYQGTREETVFSHFEKFLSVNEAMARELSKEFKIMDDIHNLRLSIKSWRYLLVEFYGVTNLSLVDCQKHLGQAVDLDRIRVELESSPQFETSLDYRRALELVVNKRNKLIKEIDYLKNEFPYGFRPYWGLVKGYSN